MEEKYYKNVPVDMIPRYAGWLRYYIKAFGLTEPIDDRGDAFSLYARNFEHIKDDEGYKTFRLTPEAITWIEERDKGRNNESN